MCALHYAPSAESTTSVTYGCRNVDLAKIQTCLGIASAESLNFAGTSARKGFQLAGTSTLVSQQVQACE